MRCEDCDEMSYSDDVRECDCGRVVCMECAQLCETCDEDVCKNCQSAHNCEKCGEFGQHDLCKDCTEEDET